MKISTDQVAHAAQEIREVEAALRALSHQNGDDAEHSDSEWHEQVYSRLRIAAVKLEAVTLTHL